MVLPQSNCHGLQVFNILCEQPETVAAFLVPRVRTVVARNEAQRYIRYLTAWSALTRFITAPLRAQRFFDADGECTYSNAPGQARVSVMLVLVVHTNGTVAAELFGVSSARKISGLDISAFHHNSCTLSIWALSEALDLRTGI